jgi:hypothetical protein
MLAVCRSRSTKSLRASAREHSWIRIGKDGRARPAIYRRGTSAQTRTTETAAAKSEKSAS